MIKFTLTGQIPSGKNAIIITRTGKRFPAERFRKWKAEALKQLKEQNIAKPMIDSPISVSVEYTPGDNRRRDVPGMIDALWHIIEHYGIVTDDRWLGYCKEKVSFKTNEVKKGQSETVVIINNKIGDKSE